MELKDFWNSEFLHTPIFFTEDSFLFYTAIFIEWSRIHFLLYIGEQAFGLKLNMDKSSVFFSHNIRAGIKDILLATTGITITMSFDKNIGLPLSMEGLG